MYKYQVEARNGKAVIGTFFQTTESGSEREENMMLWHVENSVSMGYANPAEFSARIVSKEYVDER
ncbi:hypothetical protein LA345_23445 [Burkholderia vietnamiensis]|nr:hypothetical protein [Burkholderia vietnamiensis]